MATTNDITGDRLVTKRLSEQGVENLEKIFGKKELKKRDNEYWEKLEQETKARLETNGSVTAMES
jgi:hypothetical protein